jgi:hypothetical protein
MTFLSNVMKIDSAVFLIYVHMWLNETAYGRIYRNMHCGKVGSNKIGLSSQNVSQYSPASYCDELSTSAGNLATVQYPTRIRRLIVAVNCTILYFFWIFLNAN